MLVTIVTKAALGSSTVASTTEAALNLKVDPVKIKEAIYQATPYIGYPRAEDALARRASRKGLPCKSASLAAQA